MCCRRLTVPPGCTLTTLQYHTGSRIQVASRRTFVHSTLTPSTAPMEAMSNIHVSFALSTVGKRSAIAAFAFTASRTTSTCVEEPRRRLSGPVRATQAKKAYCAVHSTRQVTGSPYVLALAGRQGLLSCVRACCWGGGDVTILAGLAGRTALAGHRQVCLYLECFRKSSAVG